MVNTALLAMVTKGCRRKLAAGITVNAGRVDKEIARNILRQSLKNIRHDNQSLNSNNGVMRLSIQAAMRHSKQSSPSVVPASSWKLLTIKLVLST